MKIRLSERMQTISDMVKPGSSVADIGTDHGYIPAYLLSEGICKKAILCDIAEGPLKRARTHFEKYGLRGDFRIGPGLEVIGCGEVSTVIIAGMGGETIIEILNKDPDKSHSYERLILQPRTYIGELRVWLSENCFKLTDYSLCRERNKIVEVMEVEPGENEKNENVLFSDFLLSKGDPLLDEYLERLINAKVKILNELDNAKDENKELIEKFQKEKSYLESIRKN